LSAFEIRYDADIKRQTAKIYQLINSCQSIFFVFY
jgi:hypothetical protein